MIEFLFRIGNINMTDFLFRIGNINSDVDIGRSGRKRERLRDGARLAMPAGQAGGMTEFC